MRNPTRPTTSRLRELNTRSKGGFLALALAALAVLTMGVWPSLAAPATPRLHVSTYGYEITLPDNWRRSDLLTHIPPAGGRLIAQEVYTIRSPQDEAAKTPDSPLPGESFNFAPIVEVYANLENISAMAWASDPQRSGWADGQSIQQVSFAGRQGAQMTNGTRFSLRYFVAGAGKMFSVGFKSTPRWSPPTGADPVTLRDLIQSFRVIGP